MTVRRPAWDVAVLYAATVLVVVATAIAVPMANIIVIAVGIAEGGPDVNLVKEGTVDRGDTAFAKPIPAGAGVVYAQAARVRRAAAHLRRGDPEAAVAVLREADRPGPDCLLLARVLADLGRSDPARRAEAREVYASLVAAMPFDPDLAAEAARLR